MNQKVIREINSILHIGLYKSVTLHYKAIVSLFVSLFVVMCVLGILSLVRSNTQAQLCSTVAGWIGYVLIFSGISVSIDRALQLIQIGRIKKKNDIRLSTVMNQHITASKRPWMVV